MFDATSTVVRRREKVRPRPFPHRHSHDCKFFVVRNNPKGAPEYLHRRNGKVFWRSSTQYVDEYHCEQSGFFASEQEARTAFAAMLRTERFLGRMLRSALPPQEQPLPQVAQAA